MAESKEGEIYWHSPDPRAIIPFFNITPPRSMRQILKKGCFSFTVNKDFEGVIRACSNREETWINDEIIDTYNGLNAMGYAHSVEVWQDNRIVGGLYGVAIRGAFFGESMFNLVPNASKAAFYYLIERLNKRDYILLDSQYINNFTSQLGAVEISKRLYLNLLGIALKRSCSFI